MPLDSATVGPMPILRLVTKMLMQRPERSTAKMRVDASEESRPLRMNWSMQTDELTPTVGSLPTGSNGISTS